MKKMHLALVFMLSALAGRADLVYDNSTNYQTNYFSSLDEFGDEINLAGTARIVTNFTFEYVGNFAGQGDETVRLRFYANDGPDAVADPQIFAPAPGTVLFESLAFAVFPGLNTVPLTGLAVAVPKIFTWTVQFSGLTGATNDQAGLPVYHPPTTGFSFKDFWLKSGPSWDLQAYPNLDPPASFAARVYATEPITSVRLNANRNTTANQIELVLNGPPGQTIVLQASPDLVSWTPISTITLASSSTNFIDAPAGAAPQRFYRSVNATGLTTPVTLTANRTLPDGRLEVLIQGFTGQTIELQRSSDLRDWTSVSTNILSGNSLSYLDPQGAAPAYRFYRALVR
jgi:hypothetical protein